jgi:hypothetical protein
VAASRFFWEIDVWPRLGVPSGPSLFFDARNVLAALECRRLGFDPLETNPCDPWDRPMVYPRVWLLLRGLGLDQSHTFAFGAFMVVAFLASILILLGRINLREGIFAATAVCSPAVMLAMERANMDLFVFAIMTLSVLLWRRHVRGREVGSPLLVLIAAVSKLYPVVGLPAFIFGRNRRSALAAAVASLAFVVYVLATRRDILAVLGSAPQGEYNSYGARILMARLYHLFVPAPWGGQSVIAQVLALVPLIALAASLWVWTRRRHPPSVRMTRPLTGNLLSFYFGTLLFLGTFAAGNNFDYRLVFILLVLPQLFEWMKVPRMGSPMKLANITLAMILLLLWIGALSEPLRTADEILSWGVAGLFLSLLARTIPRMSTLVADIDLRTQLSRSQAECD